MSRSTPPNKNDNSIEANFEALSPLLINADAEIQKISYRRCEEDFKLGMLFAKLKQNLPKEEYLDFIKRQGYTERRANCLIQVSKRFSDHIDLIASFPISTIYYLVSLPQEKLELVLEKVAEGTLKPTRRAIERFLNGDKPKAKKQQGGDLVKISSSSGLTIADEAFNPKLALDPFCCPPELLSAPFQNPEFYINEYKLERKYFFPSLQRDVVIDPQLVSIASSNFRYFLSDTKTHIPATFTEALELGDNFYRYLVNKSFGKQGNKYANVNGLKEACENYIAMLVWERKLKRPSFNTIVNSIFLAHYLILTNINKLRENSQMVLGKAKKYGLDSTKVEDLKYYFDHLEDDIFKKLRSLTNFSHQLPIDKD